MASRTERWPAAVRRASDALDAADTMRKEWRTRLAELYPELKALQQRWAEKSSELKAALNALEDLRRDYEFLQEQMSNAENLSDANIATQEKLEKVIGINFEGGLKMLATLKLFPAEETVEEVFEETESYDLDDPLEDLFELIKEAEFAELPKFYGRD
jgi:chromosome segregation ATPase